MTTGIVRWRPQTDLMRSHFGRLFDQAFNEFLGPQADAEGVSTRAWMPPVDIRETDDALTLSVELPGLKKDEVEVSLEGRVLTIRGERKFEQEKSKDNYHRIERAYGLFSRSFTLDSQVDAEKVEAAFNDGVLTITLPKVEAAKPRSIKIR